METDLAKRLQHLSISDQLLDRGCRLIFPQGFCARVSGPCVIPNDITELEIAAILQTASSNPYFVVKEGTLNCRLYYNPKDGGLIIHNFSKPATDIYLASSQSHNDLLLKQGECAALHKETWTLGTSLHPEVFIFRIIDPHRSLEDGGLLQQRDPLTFGRLTPPAHYSLCRTHHLGGPDWFTCNKKTGSNSVYIADHSEKGTIVVKSMWTPGLQNESLISRIHCWIREVKIHSKIFHDSIVQHLGHDGRCLTIFVELIPGSDLSTMTDAQNMFNGQEEVSRAIWRDTTEGLTYLRDKGIVHNDVKPANIVWNAEARRAKLLDFGLATEGPNNCGGGTPWYVAPEYWISRQRDYASDIYSLGVVVLFIFRYISLPEAKYRKRDWNIVKAASDVKSNDYHVMHEWMDEIDKIRGTLKHPEILGMIEVLPRKRYTSQMLLKQLESICPKVIERSNVETAPPELQGNRPTPVCKGSTTIAFTNSLGMMEIPTACTNSAGSTRNTRRNRTATVQPLRRSDRIAKRKVSPG